LTRSLALELAPEVRVNAILPAATRPGCLSGLQENPKGSRLGGLPSTRAFAEPNEIAASALFCGPQASLSPAARLRLMAASAAA